MQNDYSIKEYTAWWVSYDLCSNRTHIKISGGAAQELEYAAHGNIMGLMGGTAGGVTEWTLNSFVGKEYDYDVLDIVIRTKGGGLGGLGVRIYQ